MVILNRCARDSRHGFWSASWPAMVRHPADPNRLLAEFHEQAHDWALRVAVIEPGILAGRGVAKQCHTCGGGLISVSPAIQAEAERQHNVLGLP